MISFKHDSPIHKKTLLVFGMDDIASNIRILRHIRSFLKDDSNRVIALSAEETPFPTDMVNNPNFSSKTLFSCFHYSLLLSIIFFPLKIVINFYKTVFLFFSLPKVDLILSADSIMSCFFSWILSKFLSIPLIFDINAIPQTYLHLFVFKLAKFIIVSSDYIKKTLSQYSISSFVIHSSPGIYFLNNHSEKDKILQAFECQNAKYYIGIPLYHYDQTVFQYLKNAINFVAGSEKSALFTIFAPKYILAQIISHFPESQISNVQIRFEMINPSVYPKLLGACDIGIALEGDENGTPGRSKQELHSCMIPIIAADSICASEYINTNKTQRSGFVFKDEFALDLALKKTITDGDESLDDLREKCKHNFTWDEEFNNFWLSVFNQ